MLDPLEGRPLPGALTPLAELALDLRRIGSSTAARIWQAIDPDTWERTENPYLILLNAHRDRLESVARDPDLLRELAALVERRRAERARPSWFEGAHDSPALAGVAYFSMEFGLSEALPVYSGGLGILAGDHLKSASDLGVPLVGVGLLYQQGYFRQGIGHDGAQLEAWPHNDPSGMPVRPVRALDGRWLRVRVPLPGRTLLARAWEVRVGRVRVFLLDSNDARNDPFDRGISARLYDPGAEMRLLQEILLGFGGWQLLEMLGVPVDVCHLNEGHAAFAVLARAASFADRTRTPFAVALRATRAGNVFTTHTPVEAAFDRFDPERVAQLLRPFLERVGFGEDELLALGRRDPDNAHEPFHMAYLALRGSCFANGVSRLHGQVSRELFAPLFPGRPPAEVPVGHVTNGVHVASWDSPAASAFWSRATGRRHAWVRDLDTSVGALEGARDEQLWAMRSAARRELVAYVRRRLVRQVQ
jgi:starch phosphorylase